MRPLGKEILSPEPGKEILFEGVRGPARVYHEQGELHRHQALHLQRGGVPVPLSEVQDLRLLQIHTR